MPRCVTRGEDGEPNGDPDRMRTLAYYTILLAAAATAS
jgi:hypothetical protein